MTNSKPRAWREPVLFFLLSLACYGVYIPFLGLYGDDWQYLYLKHLSGVQGYIPFVAADRPFSAWIYMLLTPLLGEQPWAYHLALLLLRWLGVCAFWLLLRLIWPENRRQVTWAALIFCAYPGFRQQALPLEFMLHFSTLLLQLLSLILMLKAVRNPRRAGLYTLGGVLSALSLFGVEYFFFFELLRPLILWLVLRGEAPGWRQRLLRVLKGWLPYLLVVGGFLFWRVFVYQFQFYQPKLISGASSGSLKELLALAWKIIGHLGLALFGVWGRPLVAETNYLRIGEMALVLGIAFGGLVLALKWLVKPGSSMPEEPSNSRLWSRQAFAAGLLALIGGGAIYWVLDIPIWIGFPWDRPLLSFMPGVALIGAATIEALLQPGVRRFILAALLSLAVGLHAANAFDFIGEWGAFKAMMQQMAWRIPALEPGTIMLTERMPFLYYGDNSVSPALNWLYAPDQRGDKIPYRIFDLNIRMGSFFEELGADMPVTHTYRTFHFTGNTSQLLAFVVPEKGCLRVLTSSDAALPGVGAWLKDALYLSKTDWIDPDSSAAQLPGVFGAPPAGGWCYYFEKAGLARQQSDWAQVTALAEEAFARSLTPLNPADLDVFIEGYLRSDNIDEATRLTDIAAKDDQLHPYLCDLWTAAGESHPDVLNCP